MPNMSVSSYQNVNWSAMNSFNDLLTNMNSSGAGWLFTGITWMVFFILFITLMTGMEWEVALMVASFIGLLVGMMVVYAGVGGWEWAVAPFVGLIIISIMYRVYSRNR